MNTLKRTGKLSLVVLVLFAAAGCPYLRLVSEAEEIRLGQSLYGPYIQQSYGVYQDQALQDYLQRLGERLARHSERPNLPWHFRLVNDPQVNAFALPGGQIVVNRGLMVQITNEGQLASLVGHEVAHVSREHWAQRHSWALVAQVLVTGAAILLEMADVEGQEYYVVAGLLGTQLGFLAYSRANEREADAAGHLYMARAGYDPAGCAQMLSLLYRPEHESNSFFTTLLRTHPYTPDRMDAAREREPEMRQIALAAIKEGKLDLGTARLAQATQSLRALQPAFEAFDAGFALANEGNHQEAFRLFQQAIQQGNRVGNPQAIFHLFAAYSYDQWQPRDTARALSFADQAVNIYPDQYHARMLRGRLRNKLGQARRQAGLVQQALADLEVAERLVPDTVPVRLNQGYCFEFLGQRSQAVSAYQAVIEMTGGEGEAAGEARARLQALQPAPAPQ